jgi:hypothetical protein
MVRSKSPIVLASGVPLSLRGLLEKPVEEHAAVGWNRGG